MPLMVNFPFRMPSLICHAQTKVEERTAPKLPPRAGLYPLPSAGDRFFWLWTTESIEEAIFPMTLIIRSTAFENNGHIPKKYAGSGENLSPPLTVSGIPEGTKTLALIVNDPDASMGTFVHWVMWNIPPRGEIPENTAPGVQGKNSAWRDSYTGPNPPFGTHHYVFRLYALDTELGLARGASRKDLEGAMEGHILEGAELVGLYRR